MKRTLTTIWTLAALSGLLTLASCNKDEQEGGMEFQATMEDCTDTDGKTVLRGTQLLWSPGDEIMVFGRQGSAIYSTHANTSADRTSFRRTGAVGTGPFDGPYTAFYPADITTDGVHVTLPMVQHSGDGSLAQFPMYAQTTTDVLHFKNLCGVLRISLTKPNVNVKSILIVANSKINGKFNVYYDWQDMVPRLSDVDFGRNGHKMTWLDCETAQSITTRKYFYIYLPDGEYQNLKVLIYTDDHRYCEKTAKNNVVINCHRSQTTDIEFGSDDLDFKNMSGLFSVSPTQQVRFSPGNLQYQAITNTWRFAEHQWNYVGGTIGNYTWGNVYENGRKCNNNPHPQYWGWIDLFAWGSGNNPTRPYNPPMNDDFYLYESEFVDWGVNTIVNSESLTNAWRTLSSSEWEYLLCTRPDASSKLWRGTVNGVKGVIIIPDHWVMSEEYTLGYTGGENYTCYNYTLAQWSLLEDYGAVFLPAAGVRNGWVALSNDSPYYWSSTWTTLELFNGEREGGVCVIIGNPRFSEYLLMDTERITHSAYSVRLVQDAVAED